ncbi:MAG: phosphodiester glycosidase family protein [Armatimonadetes bacterium]|nr:phosphodiester glycosidase family protein [Candidatus Hippobium faecium]
MKGKLSLIIILLLAVSCVWADYYDWSKPAKRIHDGILLGQVAAENPNQNVFCLQIDLTKNYKFYTNPRITDEENYIDGERETWKMTVRDFMRKFQNDSRRMLVAVNNDFFSPWLPKNATDPANLINFAVSDGVPVSSPVGTPCFIVTKDGQYKIEELRPGDDISNIWVACGSSGWCLRDGVAIDGDQGLHPRTVCGMSEHGKYLYLMVIDGRRHRSVGATIKQEGEWLKYFGAWNGINFDGGGSSAMVYWDITEGVQSNRCKIINQPNATQWTGKTIKEEDAGFHIQERKVANCLGIYIDL